MVKQKQIWGAIHGFYKHIDTYAMQQKNKRTVNDIWDNEIEYMGFTWRK